MKEEIKKERHESGIETRQWFRKKGTRNTERDGGEGERWKDRERERDKERSRARDREIWR